MSKSTVFGTSPVFTPITRYHFSQNAYLINYIFQDLSFSNDCSPFHCNILEIHHDVMYALWRHHMCSHNKGLDLRHHFMGYPSASLPQDACVKQTSFESEWRALPSKPPNVGGIMLETALVFSWKTSSKPWIVFILILKRQRWPEIITRFVKMVFFANTVV